MEGGVEAGREVYELAVRALSRKERSTAELATWLRERGLDVEDVDAVIDRLTAIGELDDERFARLFAEDKQELAGWGPERVREALLARGVAPEHIETALAADPEEVQIKRANDLLVRRGRSLDSEAEKTSALGYLTRRGYSYEIAYEAIRNRSPEPPERAISLE
jgi:regulatory protein